MNRKRGGLVDTGERIIPTSEGELSFVFTQHQFVYAYASQFVRGRSVLDIGCGTGYGCKMLSQSARFVCGIDYDIEAITYCKEHFSGPNIVYLGMKALQIGLRRFFDVAVSFQVIEHVSDIHRFLEQAKYVVKSGGMIFLSTPNVHKPRDGKTSPFHQVEFNESEFRSLLSQHFSSCRLYGIGYASESKFRKVVQRLPLYHFGRFLGRKSILKKLANEVMKLNQYRVYESRIEEAIDLLAVCENP